MLAGTWECSYILDSPKLRCLHRAVFMLGTEVEISYLWLALSHEEKLKLICNHLSVEYLSAPVCKQIHVVIARLSRHCW